MTTTKTALSLITSVLLMLVVVACNKLEQKPTVSPTLAPAKTFTPKATLLPTHTATRPTLTSTPQLALTPTPRPSAQKLEIVGHIGKEATGFAAPVSTPGWYMTLGLAQKIAVAGNYAFVLQGADGPAGSFWGRLSVVDLSDLKALAPVGFYAPRWIPSDVVVISHTAYLTDGQCEFGAAACWGGLHIVDVSTPSAPTQVGIYNLDDIQSENSIGLGRSWFASGVAITNNLAYITGGPFYSPEGECGLRIVDVANRTEPKVIGKLRCKKDAAWSGSSLVVQGDFAYIAAGKEGLRIVNIANPSAPVEVGHLVENGTARNVQIEGHLAYVAADDAGLQVVDISEPTKPRKISSFKTPGRAMNLALTDGYAYVAALDAGLRVVDVSDPFKLTEVGFYDSAGTVYGVTVANDYIYIADIEEGLLVAQRLHPVQP